MVIQSLTAASHYPAPANHFPLPDSYYPSSESHTCPLYMTTSLNGAPQITVNHDIPLMSHLAQQVSLNQLATLQEVPVISLTSYTRVLKWHAYTTGWARHP